MEDLKEKEEGKQLEGYKKDKHVSLLVTRVRWSREDEDSHGTARKIRNKREKEDAGGKYVEKRMVEKEWQCLSLYWWREEDGDDGRKGTNTQDLKKKDKTKCWKSHKKNEQ